jgi:hypothetical protein
MRRSTNATHVVSLTVMRRSRHRAEIADSELSFVFPIRTRRVRVQRRTCIAPVGGASRRVELHVVGWTIYEYTP